MNRPRRKTGGSRINRKTITVFASACGETCSGRGNAARHSDYSPAAYVVALAAGGVAVRAIVRRPGRLTACRLPWPDLDSQARNDTVQKFHVFDFKRDFCGGAGIFQKRGAK